jgi:hypothetical protein
MPSVFRDERKMEAWAVRERRAAKLSIRIRDLIFIVFIPRLNPGLYIVNPYRIIINF